MTAPQPVSRLSPEEFRQRATAIEAEVGQVIVGQRDLVRQTLITMLAGGNVLRVMEEVERVAARK